MPWLLSPSVRPDDDFRYQEMGRIPRLGGLFLVAALLTSCFTPVKPGETAAPSPVAPTVKPIGQSSAPITSVAASYPSALAASVGGGQLLAGRRHEIFVISDSCASGQSCIHGPAQEHDGSDAAYLVYRATGATPAGPGPYDCFVYVYRDAAGWHPLDGYCTSQISASIGATDYIYTPGTCANIRKAPGLQAPVLDCLPHHTQVVIDQAPDWLDGHLWWHLSGRGWTVHENLFPDFNSASLTCGPTPQECWISGS